MEKEFLEKCINDNLSLTTIGKLVGKGTTTIRYWVKKYNLQSNYISFKQRGVVDYAGIKYCSRCKSDKPINEFYQRRGKEGGSTYCKMCTTKQTIERQRSFKEKLVKYKGGYCEKCGYNKYIGALEFHHLDPTQKDFNISYGKGYSFNDKIKKELDKCILVCANCHREIHGELFLA